MKLRKFLSLFLILIGININFALAQSMRYVGEVDGEKFYISANKDAMRLGKGVLAWIISENDFMMTAAKHYFPCDSKSYFSDYEFQVSVADPRSKKLYEINEYIKDNQRLPTMTSVVVEWDVSDMKLKDKVRASIREVCASASPEKRGVLFPFTETVYNKQKNRSAISAILSGTFVRKGDMVEGWMRTYNLKRTEIKKPNGEVYQKANGMPMTRADIAEDDYSIDKVSINCKENKFAFVQVNDYDNQGQLKKSDVATGAGIKYSEAVPNSTGEAYVTVICSIY